MSKLKWCCSQEHHALKRSVQSTGNRTTIFPCVFGYEEGRQTRRRIFKMMSFVQNEKRRAKSGSSEYLPDCENPSVVVVRAYGWALT